MWAGPTSLTAGGVCHPCRRIESAPYGNRTTGEIELNPYGSAHQRRRAQLLPLAIGTNCPICGKTMRADQVLALDHSVPLWLDPTPRPGDRIVHQNPCNAGWNRGMKFSTAQKASSTARGYGANHQKLRKAWKIRVDAGEVYCSHPECGRLIDPATPWDLAHDPNDRSRYAGPQHARCNRSQATATRRKNGNGNGLKTGRTGRSSRAA